MQNMETHDTHVILAMDEINLLPGPYCMSFGFNLDPLILSLKKFGLLNRPFVIMDHHGKWEVVAGYRRILALKSLNRDQLPCRDLSDGAYSPLEILLVNLYDNLSTRPFNDVEKGMALNRLMSHLPEQTVLDQYMPLLGLPSHRGTLQVLLALETLGHDIRMAFVNKQLSFQTIKALLEMDRDDCLTVFEWILELKLNFNKQTHFIDNTTDISIKKGITLRSVLEGPSLNKIIRDHKLNRPQKARLVLERLKNDRFPSLTEAEKAFEKKIAGVGLPVGVRIEHPPFFEGEGYWMKIAFKKGKTLQKTLKDLSRIDRLGGIGDPWDQESG